MKVFLLASGISVHTRRWACSLAEAGIDIVIYTHEKADKTTFANLPIKIYERKQNWAFPLLEIVAVRKLIRREKPDIVHAHYASRNGFLGALTHFHPYIVSVWGSDIYEFPHISFIHKLILKHNFRKADYIFSTSHIMAKETAKYTNKSIAITPFGVDTNLFKKKAELSDKPFVVGNVKTLEKIYGIDVLIKAFKIVVKKNPSLDCRLEIYGKGSEESNLKQLVKQLAIENRVIFKGFVENSMLPDVYNNFSVSVSVSNSESFGVVAVEAMACECPVIVSDADGFTEVVANGETGFIVPKRDAEATAQAIQKFIDNPKLRSEMGKKGRQRVLELYDWKNNVNTMIELYNEIISQQQ